MYYDSWWRFHVIEQITAGENQLEIEINIDGADTGSWFTAPVTEGFLIFGFALLLAGKFRSNISINGRGFELRRWLKIQKLSLKSAKRL